MNEIDTAIKVFEKKYNVTILLREIPSHGESSHRDVTSLRMVKNNEYGGKYIYERMVPTEDFACIPRTLETMYEELLKEASD